MKKLFLENGLVPVGSSGLAECAGIGALLVDQPCLIHFATTLTSTQPPVVMKVKMIVKHLGLLLPALFFITACSQESEPAGKRILPHLVTLPEGYAANNTQAWPLMIFLHGSGESGTDLEAVKRHGPPKLIEQGKKFPFIVVSPQSEVSNGWNDADIYNLLEYLKTNYRVDSKRVYLTGLSMGGYGAWSAAIKYPDAFAAIAPICGGGDPSKVSALKNMPVWCFHGALDETVRLSESERMVNALRVYNKDVKFTVYPDLYHDSWTTTYENEELYTWFLSHHK